MLRLLRGNLKRIIKSKFFWLCFALYAFYPILIVIVNADHMYETITSDKVLSLNYGLEWLPLQGVFIAFICSILFCSDFHNLTIRNKLVIGHSKNNIYLANLLSMIIISIALSVIYLLLFFMIAMPVFGRFTSSASTVIWVIVNGTLMLVAYSSIMTLIAMTSKNPTVAIVISIVVLTIGALLAFFMNYIATIPPYYENYEWGENGEFIIYLVPTEHMPSKEFQSFARFLVDCLPSGQSLQISSGGYTRNWQMALYSLGLIGATSGAGILVFKKRNLK